MKFVRMQRWYSGANVLHNAYTAWIVLFSSVLLTVVAYVLSNQFVQQRIQDRFDFLSRELEAEIENQLLVYEQVLRSTVSLIYASDELDRSEFEFFVKTLQLDKYWPGIQGIGLSVLIRPNEKQAFEQSIRAEGFDGFTVSPSGDRQLYSAIKYLEPFDWRNRRAFGYDMYSNPVRREAMDRAWQTGEVATSGKIILVQETDTDRQNGFLTYLPVYRSKQVPTSQRERQEQLIGWVYAAFRAKDLMIGVTGGDTFAIHFAIYDGEEISPDALLYQSPRDSQLQSISALRRSSTLKLQGHPWTLDFEAGTKFLEEISNKNLPQYVVVAGLTVDLLLFYVIMSLSFVNRKVEQLAQEKTQDLIAAHTAIKKQTAFANTIVDKLPLVLVVKDLGSGRVIRTNEFANDLFDDGSEEGKSLFKQFQQRLTKHFQSSETDESGVSGNDIDILTLQGQRWFNAQKIVIEDDSMEQGYSLLVATDITERVNSEDRFQSLFELAPSGLLLVDSELRIKQVNHTLCEMLGYSPTQFLSKTVPQILVFQTSSEQNQLTKLIHQLSITQPLFKACQVQTATGDQVDVEISVKLLPSEEDKYWLLAISDVSGHVRLVKQLENASRYKSEFLASMSHELRTPLNSVIGFTTRIQKSIGHSLDSRNYDALEAVNRNAHQLLALINDILDLSKIEAGRMEVLPVEVDVRQLLDIHLQSLLPMAKTKGLDFRINLTPVPIVMNTDKNLILRIVNNLVSNAIKYTDEGEIRVSLELYEDSVWGESLRLRVSDSGIGITHQDQAKLFSEFIRLDDARSHAVEGTGLGLAITARLVDMLEGRIKVASIYGEGSTFTVELPLSVAEFSGLDNTVISLTEQGQQ